MPFPSKFRTHVELVRALARALRLDPDTVPITRIAIEASVKNIATATVTFIVDAEQDDAISEVIRTHQFKEEPESTVEKWPDDKTELKTQAKSWREEKGLL